MADLFEAALVVGGLLQLPALPLDAAQAQPGSTGLRHQQQGLPLTQPRPLQNALTEHVIPKLPDVTQIPDSSWAGWDPIFQELQVDRNNVAQVQETIGRCQATLTNLLQAAIMNGQQAAFEAAAQLGDEQVWGDKGRTACSKRQTQGSGAVVVDTPAAGGQRVPWWILPRSFCMQPLCAAANVGAPGQLAPFDAAPCSVPVVRRSCCPPWASPSSSRSRSSKSSSRRCCRPMVQWRACTTQRSMRL